MKAKKQKKNLCCTAFTVGSVSAVHSETSGGQFEHVNMRGDLSLDHSYLSNLDTSLPAMHQPAVELSFSLYHPSPHHTAGSRSSTPVLLIFKNTLSTAYQEISHKKDYYVLRCCLNII